MLLRLKVNGHKYVTCGGHHEFIFGKQITYTEVAVHQLWRDIKYDLSYRESDPRIS